MRGLAKDADYGLSQNGRNRLLAMGALALWDRLVAERDMLGQLLSGAPILSTTLAITLISIGFFIARAIERPRLNILKERLALYQDKLNVSSPEEAARKIADLERRIEEVANQPAVWG